MTTGSGLFLSEDEKDPVRQNFIIRQLIEGRSNAVGTFTLTASVTSTSVTAINCSPFSVVVPVALTANASNDFGLMSITPSTGTFTVRHASNARTDRSFSYSVQG